MTDKKRRIAQGETDEERAYEKAVIAAYENDIYWLKYLDGQDYETVFVHGEETPEQTRDRRNKAAIRGAYLDARQTRSEEEALAFVLDVIESVKAADRFDEWIREGREKATPDEIAKFGDDLPF